MSSATSPHSRTTESKDLASWRESKLDTEWIGDGEPELSHTLNSPWPFSPNSPMKSAKVIARFKFMMSPKTQKQMEND